VEDPSLRLGVDVGGTFTDLVLAGRDGVEVAKVPSTPHDQAEGVLAGLASRARRAESRTVRPRHDGRDQHGAGTRRRRTVLVTTAGFRDLLTIGRQARPHLYDLAGTAPAPLVPAERSSRSRNASAPTGRS
jgi:N-methylhydantoinase A